VGLGWLSFVALVPLLVAVDRGAGLRRAALAGWIAGVVFFAFALAWIPLAGIRGALLALVAGYVLTMALTLAAFAALLAWLRSRDRVSFLAAAPLAWIVLEYARAQGSLGYPLHHLGYSLAGSPALVQLAAFGGVHGLSLWIAGVNVAIVAARGAAAWSVGIGAAVLAAPLALAPGLLDEPAEGGESLRVTGIQPGVLEPGRADLHRFRLNLRTLVDLTDDAVAGGSDLVVWPESAFERSVRDGAHEPFLGGVALHYGTPLLTGAWRLAPGAPTDLYNSAVLARPTGEVIVAGDKVRPVALHERKPASSFERAMGRLGLWPGRFRAGKRSGLVHLEHSAAGTVGIGLLICADSTYPGLARDLRRRGARLMVEISNEAQIGAWSAVQHAHVSRLRAVETGVPLVRIANTGPSEWIDSRGRLAARIPPGRVGAKTATLALAGAPTFYQRAGHAPTFVFALLPLLIQTLRARRIRRGSELPGPAISLRKEALP
jgi:apolipoprotein N-acyltransferase